MDFWIRKLITHLHTVGTKLQRAPQYPADFYLITCHKARYSFMYESGTQNLLFYC